MSSLSLLPPVSLNRGLTFSRGHPWLAVKRSGINVWVEQEWREWSMGHRVGGVGLVGGSEWLSGFLMECRHTDSPSVFPPPPLLFYSSLSFSLSLSSARLPGSSPLPPIPPLSFPPILSSLIVLHLFIQAFMATSSSCRPISPPDDGFLPQLSQLFIISVDPHHISLTLGRWFSHWTTLLTRHITNPLGSAHKHMYTHTQSDTATKRPHHHRITLQIYKALKAT